MDGLTLLHQAKQAGLVVRAEHDRLIIRGPRSKESLARQLLDHKVEVLAALGEGVPAASADGGPWPVDTCLLSAEAFSVRTIDDLLALWDESKPPTRCHACRCRAWWRLKPSGPWTCCRCHPPHPPSEQIETWNPGPVRGR